MCASSQKFLKNSTFSCLILLFFMNFHQLRIHHDMDLVQTVSEGYWRKFEFFLAFSIRTTHVFRRDVFGNVITKFFSFA